MKKKSDIGKSILVLAIICLVVSGLLAIVNSFTAPISLKNAKEREDAARRELLPEAVEFIEKADDRFPEGVVSAHEAIARNGESLGYIITTEGKGFAGTIRVMTAIDDEGIIIKCNTLDVSSETPPLGGQTALDFYTNRYIGKDSSLKGVHAITGATITSDAYRRCVADAFKAYHILEEA